MDIINYSKSDRERARRLLQEYTEEPDVLTDNIEEAIFLLEDGRMISGEFYSGIRSVDHGCLKHIVPDGYPNTWELIHMYTGIVRIVPETGAALISQGQTLNHIQLKEISSTHLTVWEY